MKHDEMDKVFGTNMRVIRAIKGLSLKEISKKVGVTYASLYSYEKCNREPPVSIACKIADALGVSITDLISEDLFYKIGTFAKKEKERCRTAETD